MININLTQGKVAVIDEEDYEKVCKHKWYYAHYPNGGYAKAYNSSNRSCHLRMHRIIVGAKDGQKVDHINGDTLDNRKSNLRIVNQSQNMMNTGIRVNNKSGFKGVCKHNDKRYSKKWLATTWKDGKQIFIGHFKTAREAAKAYNKKVLEIHGEYAVLNKI